MASQDARLSEFEADFKRQQGEMTNKIDTVLKAITDQIAGTLPSDTVKNPKLGTHLVLSALSYPKMDPQCSSYQSTSINAIKAHFKEDLHLNLPVLEVLAHTQIYNAILDKYVESLELGKNGSAFVQGEVPAKMVDPKLFTLPCRLKDSKPFDTLVDLGSCINIMPLYLFKKLNIRLLEETDHIFGLADGTKSYPVGIVKDVEVHIGKLKLLNNFYIIDMKKDPKTPSRKRIPRYRQCSYRLRMVEFLGAIPINLKCNTWESEDLIKNPINWDKPPKNGDGAWHDKIRLIDPDGEEFTKTLQSIPLLGSSLKEKVIFDKKKLVFSIWKVFEGNTRDLGSFGEETDKTTNLHQHCSRISPQKLETASQITRDAVTNPTTTTSQDIATESAYTIQSII
ncbi:DNA-directed DNA polymerase [Tanacetum coccineum]